MEHTDINPSILYFGTPVVLVGTRNSDGTTNLAPISSAFWLADRAVIGIAHDSKTRLNLGREGECTLNLVSADLAEQLDRLALTTGARDISVSKQQRGYRYVPDKFAAANLTEMPSSTVRAGGVAECPVILKARATAMFPVAEDDANARGRISVHELKVLRVRAHPSILDPHRADHVDPDRWQPLIMSFQKLYGVTRQVRPSRLASIPEHLYRPECLRT